MLTVGEILRNTRENKNILLSDIEKHIRVRAKFLNAIENNDWTFFSSKIYITGIIKNYSRYLGLDPKKMQAFFRRDYEKKEDVHFKTRIASKYLTPETKKYAIFGIIILFFLFFVYFGYQVKQYLTPPTFIVLSPKETTFRLEDKIKFVAKTEKDAMVTIAGERVYQDKNGVFIYDYPLKNGKNELTIEITGANGKKIIVKKVFVKNSPQ
jgi:hypothetical protein